MILETEIKIPELYIQKSKVQRNNLLHLAEAEHVVRVKVYEHTRTSYRLVDELEREIYLKLPRSKANTKNKKYVLRASGISDIQNLDTSTSLKWERHYRLENVGEPSEIVNSWKNSFYFVKENLENEIYGLRKPQVGAIHSISAHWSVTEDCATVVMPTGTGKTEVMISTLISEQCKKLLIVVPTSPLRDQMFNKFLSLGCLQNIKVVPNDIFFPRVASIEKGIRDLESARRILGNSDVLIATVDVLRHFSEESLHEFTNSVSHLFIDEAHHAPAKTWTELKNNFVNSRILQFTATPYRNDGKKIEGRIIYDYPLGLAQKNGYFKKINLIKISESEELEADVEIARQAIAKLQADLDSTFDHIIMARAKSIKRAEEIFNIYKREAAHFNPQIVHNRLSTTERRRVDERLLSRETRIIVCVNMLGEGYDLPNLKIAALHDIHKNLTTTMQFIGRFTRTSSGRIGNASVVVNFAEPKVEGRLEELYSESPDWDEILRQQSESTIQKERELQEVILSFRGGLSQQVSLWNLRPSFSSLVYKTNAEFWTPNDFEKILPKRYKCWSSISQDEKLLVFVISKEDEVDWGKYKDIKDLTFELCVVYWDTESQKLFIYCSDYNAVPCDRLAKHLCGEGVEVIKGLGLFHLFSGVNYPMIRNLGASQRGIISFTMYFGPDVTKGFSEIEMARSVPNNIFGWGYEDGDRVTYGCSAKTGKIWSHGGGSIAEWRDWCNRVKNKVTDSNELEPAIIEGFLKPIALNSRYESLAIAVDWGESILRAPENRVYIYFEDDENMFFDVGLEISEYNSDGPIIFSVNNDNEKSTYKLEFVEGIPGNTVCKLIEGREVFVKKYSGEKISLPDYLKKDPLIVRYVDGTFSFGNYHVPVPDIESFYDMKNLQTLDWSGTNIRVESEGMERDRNSIQYRVIEEIKEDYDIVINDDGSYEAADIIALRKESDHSLTMHLIHCKFSQTDNPGADVRNLYDLCGQAQKCIRWKYSGIQSIVEHVKQREKRWKAEGSSRFIKGDEAEFMNLKRFAKKAELKLEVSIYQPGLSKSKAGKEVALLLASTENYLAKTCEAPLYVVCSE